ncbi:Leucine aminopeptidase 1, partial [Lobulomyces angularis]
YYKSPSGKESSIWLLNQVKDIANKANTSKVSIQVEPFEHSWGQNSVIARIVPVGPPKLEGVTIVGAHQDSVNQWNPWFGRSPGADDDGSGTTTIFETFRILVNSGYTPDRVLEFHWYSAEEGGLLGSQAVASKYRSENAVVAGMFQVDMTGYKPPNK